MNFIKKHKIISAFAIIILAAGGYYFYGSSKSGKSEIRYVLNEAQKGTLIVSVSGSGNIEADEIADLTPEITGEIDSVKTALGDKVQKGQIIATIKNDELNIKEQSALSALNIAKEAVTKAKLDRAQKYQDYYDLKQKQKDNPSVVSNLDIKIAAQKVRDADLVIKSAEIKVKSAEFDYSKAKENAAARILKSPMDGTVTAFNVKIGDEIGTASASSANRASLIVITDLDKLFAKISLNEIDAARIKPDQKATLVFDAIEELTLTGRVAEIDTVGTVTQGIVSYNAKITIDSADNRIKPGMSVSAAVVTDIKQDTVIISNGAVKTDGNIHYIEIVDQSIIKDRDSQGVVLFGQPRRVTVEIGLSNDISTEIISGINPGDQAVVRTVSDSTQSANQAPGLFGGSNSGASSGRIFRMPR